MTTIFLLSLAAALLIISAGIVIAGIVQHHEARRAEFRERPRRVYFLRDL